MKFTDYSSLLDNAEHKAVINPTEVSQNNDKDVITHLPDIKSAIEVLFIIIVTRYHVWHWHLEVIQCDIFCFYQAWLSIFNYLHSNYLPIVKSRQMKSFNSATFMRRFLCSREKSSKRVVNKIDIINNISYLTNDS